MRKFLAPALLAVITLAASNFAAADGNSTPLPPHWQDGNSTPLPPHLQDGNSTPLPPHRQDGNSTPLPPH